MNTGKLPMSACNAFLLYLEVFGFDASTSKTPAEIRMALEKGICANIMAASTKTISGKAYGNMLLGIAGDRNDLEAAMSYLTAVEDVVAEEVDD